MATVSMMTQPLLPSQLVQVPQLMCGVTGYVRSLGPQALLAAAIDDSSDQQVAQHVPHERLMNLVAPDFMRRFGHHRHSPV